jgi:hypothetical protein
LKHQLRRGFSDARLIAWLSAKLAVINDRLFQFSKLSRCIIQNLQSIGYYPVSARIDWNVGPRSSAKVELNFQARPEKDSERLDCTPMLGDGFIRLPKKL